ncbi:MAG: LysR substrate-binding domain-containing protein [Leucobacter sp.]
MSTPSGSGRGLIGLTSVDLNLLVPLLALLEEKSVTRAASRVSLSQPAMSHALRRLRRLLDDELLVRQGGSMILTPFAESLLAPVRRALSESVRVLRRTSFDPTTDDRTVTIALTTSTAFAFGPLLRAMLDERAPRMTLRLRTGDMSSPSIFTSDGADVALLTEGLHSPHPRERLYDDHWVVLASPNIPADRTAIELLGQEPHIVYDATSAQLRPYEVLDREGIGYRVRQTVSDYILIPHLLRESRGVGLHRFQVASHFVQRDGLRMVDFPFPIAPLGIDTVWNPWLADDEYRDWLRELLRDAAAPLRARSLAHSDHSSQE